MYTYATKNVMPKIDKFINAQSREALFHECEDINQMWPLFKNIYHIAVDIHIPYKKAKQDRLPKHPKNQI